MGWITEEDAFPRGFRKQARVLFQLVILGLGRLDILLGSNRSIPLTPKKAIDMVVVNKHQVYTQMGDASSQSCGCKCCQFLFY